MNETYEQKKRRLFGKQFLKEYFKQVNSLLKVESYRVLTILETDIVLLNISTLKKIKSKIIPFEDKIELKKIIIKIFDINEKIILFIYQSNYCGAIEFNSINEFNFDFDFNDENKGLITLINSSCKQKVILDFYIENNLRLIEIEQY